MNGNRPALPVNLYALLLMLVALMCGCAGRSGAPARRPLAATQPVTDVDPVLAEPAYWLEQPAIVSVEARDFEQLWSAAEEVARDFQFRIDRRDLRGGLLITEPLTSAQWFELWRHDARTLEDAAESSLATVRRTLRFEFAALDSGGYQTIPKVLVERQAMSEQRLTSAVSYRRIFARPANPSQRPRGTRESDVGLVLPARYWYAIGRDDDLERAVARAIESKVK